MLFFFGQSGAVNHAMLQFDARIPSLLSWFASSRRFNFAEGRGADLGSFAGHGLPDVIVLSTGLWGN
jgi:hypothetical protein